MKKIYPRFIIVGIFAVAMGLLEAIVVVYLRKIYYPDGFSFPLAMIDPGTLTIELVREIATIVMLVTVGLLAGRTMHEKFAWFLFTFGVWDIIYYAGLKIFLDWPESLLTWDVLFLIPITWIGPVLAPVICSLTMILFAVLVICLCRRSEEEVRFGRLTWTFIIAGAVLIFISFIQDFTGILIHEGFFTESSGLTNQKIIDTSTSFVPTRFNWWLFITGEAAILWGIIRIYLINFRNKKIF